MAGDPILRTVEFTEPVKQIEFVSVPEGASSIADKDYLLTFEILSPSGSMVDFELVGAPITLLDGRPYRYINSVDGVRPFLTVAPISLEAPAKVVKLRLYEWSAGDGAKGLEEDILNAALIKGHGWNSGAGYIGELGQ